MAEPFISAVGGSNRAYTAETLKAFRDAGVKIYTYIYSMGAVGGKGEPDDICFDRLAELLKADEQGIHQALGDDTKTKIVIHIDGADATGIVQWFFDHITSRHVAFDIIGLSYYPSSGDSLDHVKQTLDFVAKRYGKPVVIAETAYPFMDSPANTQRKSFAWPLTPQGQKQYVADLLQLVRETPGGLGGGILYWYPESVPPKNSGERMWNDGDAAMFDHDGNALPVFDALGK